jgi:nitrogen fixation/metabolism regulation signal transduction histidine kinase
MTDVSRALREEERQAWKRLVRVMGHELNSSLTPIKSMASTVQKLVARDPLPADWRADAESGLTIIHDRADALGRFVGAYARLARLPPPSKVETELSVLIGRAVSLFGDRVSVRKGPRVSLNIDADQIEQVLINLIKNAVEAVEKEGRVSVRWQFDAESVVIEVIDDGTGLSKTENLWVPFFTTKQGGTGLGLVLSREIIENHAGEISLANRKERQGCIARVALPVNAEMRFVI